MAEELQRAKVLHFVHVGCELLRDVVAFGQSLNQLAQRLLVQFAVVNVGHVVLAAILMFKVKKSFCNKLKKNPYVIYLEHSDSTDSFFEKNESSS